MSGFDRLGNVIEGAVSNALGDVERANADAVYEAAIEAGKQRIADHTEALAALAARRDQALAGLEAHEVEHSAEAVSLVAQVEETKRALQQLRESVESLQRERTAALAQLAAAEAMIQVNDAMDGTSDRASERALDSVRESVGVLNRRAHPGYLDSEGNSIRGRVAAMSEKSAEQRARDELERLKREHASVADGDDTADEGDPDDEAP